MCQFKRWTSLSLCSQKLRFNKDGEGNTFSFLTLLNEHTKPCMCLVPLARHEQNAGGSIRAKCTSKVCEYQKNRLQVVEYFEYHLQWWVEFQDFYRKRKEICSKRRNNMIKSSDIKNRRHVHWKRELLAGIYWRWRRYMGGQTVALILWRAAESSRSIVNRGLCWYELYWI